MENYIIVSVEDNIITIKPIDEDISNAMDIETKLENVYATIEHKNIILDLTAMSSEITTVVEILDKFVTRLINDEALFIIVSNNVALDTKLLSKFPTLIINTNLNEAKDYIMMEMVEREIGGDLLDENQEEI